jgi:RNA polymerase sigma-70 factor (ECF subfamily)
METPRFLDEVVFEELFRSHFKGLTHFAVTYVKDGEAAREIVQEAFINLWEKRTGIDLSKPVKSYLTTSVRNRCLNYLRDNKKFSSDLLAIEHASVNDYYEQSDKLVEAEIRDKIAGSIGELPEKCREIFVLSRSENMKYQEIADRLQISVKTVEAQMSKALQHLRGRLGEYLSILVFAISLFRYLAIFLFLIGVDLISCV